MFFAYNILNINLVFLATKTECKNEGQQAQWIKMQNATKQTLQEKNLTAVITKNNVQNNIASVSLCIGVIFKQNFF